MLGSHTFLSIKTAEIFVCSISSWNITMKVTALMLLLALAVHGQDHDANNRQPKAPFFFNPLTLTIYATNRAVSTSYVACLTQQTGLPVDAPACRRRRSLEEEITPSIVESVEPTAAPVVRESRSAQFDPLDAFYVPPAVLRAYYSPYIRGSFDSYPAEAQQRFLFPNFAYSTVTLYTSTITITTAITVPCVPAVNSCPPNIVPVKSGK